MPEKLLEVKNLSTVFKKDDEIVRAVDDISFIINRGETIGIVGESGSGKSVTALSIIGLIRTPPGIIEQGSILYQNKNKETIDLLNLDKDKINAFRGSEISMIFQEPMTSLNPVFTCGAQVIESITLHQKQSKIDAKKIALDLFKKVKLQEPDRIFNAYPHELSGGQKQRVMIAMAISSQPNILIADEPTTALDVTVQKAILNLLKDLKSDLNAGILFISHDLGVIAEVADRVIVMHRGKIVEQGNINEVLKSPKHPYTQRLLLSRPPLNVKLKKLPEKIEGKLNDLKAQIMTKEEIEQRKKAILQKEILLKVEKLSTHFVKSRNFFGKPIAHLKAVNQISFHLREGETLGLVGESGSGKTTLGRSILKLIQTKEGKVCFQGKDIGNLNQKELRKFRKEAQIIFQDPYSSLNPRMTVGQILAEPIKFHGIEREKEKINQRIRQLLSEVQLEENHIYRFPHEFSGGQRQRICIARALAVEPKLLICDESVSALDVSVQAKILNLLIDLRDRYNLSLLFISHDLSVVKFIADRIMVMQNGNLVEIGDSEAIYKAPKTAYTQKLIDSIPKDFA